MAFKGVLLDVDGTLVLSNDAHAQSWVEAFAAYGYNFAFGQLRPLIGMGGDKIIPMLVPDLEGEVGVGKEISERRKTLVLEKFVSQLKAAKGARKLVKKIQESGFKIAVASSATEQELTALLKAANVEDLIQIATTSSESENSKPDSDIVEAALKKIDLPPNDTVMLGDTPYDIEAGHKAGVGVIAVRCGGFSDTDLQGAIAIYDDPADLLQHYDESPLGCGEHFT